MNKLLRNIVVIGMLIIEAVFCCAVAQTKVSFAYDTDFLLYFDNREYDRTPGQRSQTIFGVRLAPEIGVQIADSTESKHRLMAGVSYNQPFGASWGKITVKPTIYYRIETKGFDINLGFVPYRYLKENLPEYLLSDSISYYNSNLQGALFQYESEMGFASLMADWRGMYSEETREAFRVIIGGQYRYKWLQAGGYAMLNHLANSTQTNCVYDDIMINPYVGVNLGEIVAPLDSFNIRLGYIGGFQRERATDTALFTHAFNAELFLRWRFLGFKQSFYYGDSLYPLYDKQQATLNMGDPWYKSKLYSRTDFFIYLYNNRFVNCYFSFNLHVNETGNVNCQQQIIAQFNLGKVFSKKGSPKLKSLLGK
jgi:hypothetical protein